jgi:hypothetical protein
MKACDTGALKISGRGSELPSVRFPPASLFSPLGYLIEIAEKIAKKHFDT